MPFLMVIFLLIAVPATAQTFSFTPPNESRDISNYGVHFDALQLFPGDRWSTFVYNNNGAFVYNQETLTVPIIYGLVDAALGGNVLDPDSDGPRDRTGEPDRTNSNARATSGFIDLWLGQTFLKTPFGEAGVGLDVGIILLQTSPRWFKGDDAELDSQTGQIGPNLLFTSRPIENLHTVVHASYQFLGSADAKSGRKVLDIQGHYRLNNWFGLYGGIHLSTWDAEHLDTTYTYTSKGISFGLTFVNLGNQLF